MGCLDGLITTDSSVPSRLGLYANDLPGITLDLFFSLRTDDQADYQAFWTSVYNRSLINFVNEAQSQLSDKFHIDRKLVSRETSQFTNDTVTVSNPGLQILYLMPKYARIYIVNLTVYSNTVVASADFKFYDTDQNGTLLLTKTVALTQGINTIYIDSEFEVSEILFITFSSSSLSLRQTVNRYFRTYNYVFWDKLSCTFPCLGGDYNATINQISGGGINAVFNIICSTEKFICQNINIFKNALWWKIGVELMIERITSDRFNKWTTITTERATELKAVYQEEFDRQIKMAVNNLRVQEDQYCYICKSAVSAQNLLP